MIVWVKKKQVDVFHMVEKVVISITITFFSYFLSLSERLRNGYSGTNPLVQTE